MLDRRYPYLWSLESAWAKLTHEEEKYKRRFARDIKGMVGVDVAIDVSKDPRIVYLYRGTVEHGQHSFPLRTHGSPYRPTADSVAKIIRSGEMSAAEKDRLVARREAELQSERKAVVDKERSVMVSEAVKDAERAIAGKVTSAPVGKPTVLKGVGS